MVRVKYLGGFCRLYGQEFYTSLGWYEVNNTVYLRVRGSPEWLVEGEEESVEEVEEVEEVVEEAVEEPEEETSDETDLSTLSKKDLQALCDEADLTYKSLDNKAALISLLEGNDEEE